ncbi:UNVERIFIED_CONTAM: hypothetical protein RF653_10050 [Kocuria sp. CPCC 205316]|uniref:hypothetical protein n=1 Tax=Kocuria TaxID=57493 RepID=UPI0036D94568
MTLAKFDIKLQPTTIDVKINGEPVGLEPVSVQIVKEGPYDLPRVALLFDALDVKINGEGLTELRSDHEDLARFLESIDPKTLEAEALERTSFGTSPTAAMLNILKELASGS